MDIVYEIVKIGLPSLLLLVLVYFMMNKFLSSDEQRRKYELYKSAQKETVPLRFTAYERIVLFLERISPDSLLVRMQDDRLTAIQLHATLLTAIRAEYEHNLAQQVYVSDDAWELVKNSKESIIQLINASAAQVPPGAPALDLSKVILATYEQAENTPTEVAISFLKNELKRFFV